MNLSQLDVLDDPLTSHRQTAEFRSLAPLRSHITKSVLQFLAQGLLCMLALMTLTATVQAQPAVKVPMQPAIQVPMIASQWVVKGETSFAKDAQLHQATLTLNDGSATLKHTRFADGTISFDVKFADSGLCGIAFRKRGDTSDVLYFRPGANCSAKDDCIQYTAREHGILEWDFYPQYQTRAPIRMEAWNHITLVMSGRRLAVFVNNGSTPVLVVNHMAGDYPSGELELHGAASFANLVVTPGKTARLPQESATASTRPDEHFFGIGSPPRRLSCPAA